MNYRHAFHAGNFADVLKHTVLLALIDALCRKSAPFCFIDTHAGAGRYDLTADEAQKTRESIDGIARLNQAGPLPPLLQRYVDAVKVQPSGFYPGSPLLAATLMRAGDSAHLCEIQPDEVARLRRLFDGDPRVHVHARDGYEALKALLPPRERRGLVLIDPPYETQDDEFRTIQSALETALQRWPTGIYAIWYPIKLRRTIAPFHRWLTGCGSRRVLAAELLLHPDDSPLRLNGAGMAVINAPWQFDRLLADTLPDMARHLGERGATQHRLLRLVDEDD